MVPLLTLGVFGFLADDDLAPLVPFFSLDGVLAGEAAGWLAGVSTLGASATGSALATLGVLALGALVLGVLGLLDDLALDLLAFCD